MGDVSGHGLGASLFMAAARSLLRALLPRSADPAETLREVNRSLGRDMPSGTFMSLFLGEIDVPNGTLRYASAGHEPGLLWRGASGVVEELGATGPALGIVRDGSWGIGVATDLRPGDAFLLYTDGATEALGPLRERFGLPRLREHFAAAAVLPPSRAVAHLERAVDAWGSRADDCSMLVARTR
jgi:sigma-B regulation protein RsbU (phosphoserine phosphatase)